MKVLFRIFFLVFNIVFRQASCSVIFSDGVNCYRRQSSFMKNEVIRLH